MRRRTLASLMLIPAFVAACSVDQPTSPRTPAQPAFAAGTCALNYTVEQARTAIATLTVQINALETSGALSSGQANALRGHLENALRQLDAGKTCAAAAQFAAFRQQVANFEADGILTPQQSLPLVQNATQVLVGPPNRVTVNTPSTAAGEYDAGYAEFGPQPTLTGVTAPIVLVSDASANPTLGCNALVGFPAGAIALIERGTCEFDLKTRLAQEAGAIAVIVYDNNANATVPPNMAGADPSIAIPTVSVTRVVGLALRAGLPATGTVSRKPW